MTIVIAQEHFNVCGFSWLPNIPLSGHSTISYSLGTWWFSSFQCFIITKSSALQSFFFSTHRPILLLKSIVCQKFGAHLVTNSKGPWSRWGREILSISYDRQVREDPEGRCLGPFPSLPSLVCSLPGSPLLELWLLRGSDLLWSWTSRSITESWEAALLDQSFLIFWY